MACNTNRCALRRFDGHGSGSYRPSNSGLAKENENSLVAIIAARKEMDKMYGPQFGIPDGVLIKPTPEFKTQEEEIEYMKDNLFFAGTASNPDPNPSSTQKHEFTTWKTPRASSDYQK